MPTVQEQMDSLFAALDSGIPMEVIMRKMERDAGRRVVVPGEVEWLPEADWLASVVVSIDGIRVRIIAIAAKEPGKGAFRRLVAGIQAAGLIPCVVAPVQEMRETLRRWKWKGRTIGYGFEAEERWEPRS
jgi:hypothetical protein